MDNDDLLQLLICPLCHADLNPVENGFVCHQCGQNYPTNGSGQIDLRIPQSRTITIDFEIGKTTRYEEKLFPTLEINPSSSINLKDHEIPYNLPEEFVSYFPLPSPAANLMLDIGCGDGIHKSLLEDIGFQWIGMDYTHPDAPLLGDAHALPLRDTSVHFVLAKSILQECQHPQVIVQEIFRVLQPGGLFAGSASFLEPFYRTTYAHFSHMGIHNLLTSAGFQIVRVAPSADWNALVAISQDALFPQLPGPLAVAMIKPLELLHKLWWKLGYILSGKKKGSELSRIQSISGATYFIAKKPADSEIIK